MGCQGWFDEAILEWLSNPAPTRGFPTLTLTQLTLVKDPQLLTPTDPCPLHADLCGGPLARVAPIATTFLRLPES